MRGSKFKGKRRNTLPHVERRRLSREACSFLQVFFSSFALERRSQMEVRKGDNEMRNYPCWRLVV